MNLLPSTHTITVLSGTDLDAPPGGQALAVVHDAAGFINRGLAQLWRDRIEDLGRHFEEALECMASGDISALEALLRDYPDLLDHRSSADEGFQLLHHAAHLGCVEAIPLLVRAGAAIDAPSGHLMSDGEGFFPGLTPLLLAVVQGSVAAASCLLALGANPDARFPDSGETALHRVAAKGPLQMVDVLAEGGAELDILGERLLGQALFENLKMATPLHVAAFYGRADVLRALLSVGALHDACGEACCLALHYAAASGHIAPLEALLAAGSDPNALGRFSLHGRALSLSALHCAILQGHVEAVSMLMCYGADAALEVPAVAASAHALAAGLDDPLIAKLMVHALRGGSEQEVFSHLDARSILCVPARYGEQRDFLINLLTEFPVGDKGLLVLSDWLAEMLGAEHRPHLARAYREVMTGEVG